MVKLLAPPVLPLARQYIHNAKTAHQPASKKTPIHLVVGKRAVCGKAPRDFYASWAPDDKDPLRPVCARCLNTHAGRTQA